MNTISIHPLPLRWPAIVGILILLLLPAAAGQGQPNDNLGGGASAALEATKVAKAISDQPFEGRENLLTDIDGRVTTAAAALRNLEVTSKVGLFNASPKALKDAIAEAEAREGELRRRLDEARGSTKDTWIAVRTELGSGYSAYANAVARAEAAAAESKKG